MKKLLLLACIVIGAAAFAQQLTVPVKVYDDVTDGDTNIVYIGTATASKTSVPAKDEAKWQIKRIISVSNKVQSVDYAIGSGSGDATWKSAVWDDRATTNITYSVVE